MFIFPFSCMYICLFMFVGILNPRLDDMPYMLFLSYTCLGLFLAVFAGGGLYA